MVRRTSTSRSLNWRYASFLPVALRSAHLPARHKCPARTFQGRRSTHSTHQPERFPPPASCTSTRGTAPPPHSPGPPRRQRRPCPRARASPPAARPPCSPVSVSVRTQTPSHPPVGPRPPMAPLQIVPPSRPCSARSCRDRRPPRWRGDARTRLPSNELEADRQARQAVDARDALELRLAVQLQAARSARQERQRLAQLRPRQVRTNAVVHARAERQLARAAPIRRDVKAFRATRPALILAQVAVGRERAHHHDRPLRERHAT